MKSRAPFVLLAACGLLLALCLACGLSAPLGFERPGYELRVSLYGPCLVQDRNGDGAGELALLLYNDFERQRPALLDGATGEILWEGDEYQGSDVKAYCVGLSHFAVAPPGGAFQLDLYSVANPGAPQRLSLSDQPSRVGCGPGCFTLRTRDRQVTSYALGATVTPGPCAAEADQVSHDHPNVANTNDPPLTLSHDGVTYELGFREEGTELVRVSQQGGWSRELSLLGTGNVEAAGMLPVPGGVVVVGAPHPEVEDTALVLFLNAADGSERARYTFLDRNNTNVGEMTFNGRYAVIKLGNTVHAFDPATGAEAWTIGHSNAPTRP